MCLYYTVLPLPSMALDPRFPAGMTNIKYSVNEYLTPAKKPNPHKYHVPGYADLSVVRQKNWVKSYVVLTH